MKGFLMNGSLDKPMMGELSAFALISEPFFIRLDIFCLRAGGSQDFHDFFSRLRVSELRASSCDRSKNKYRPISISGGDIKSPRERKKDDIGDFTYSNERDGDKASL